MKNNTNHDSGIFTPRVLVAFGLCSCGVLLGMYSFAATPPSSLGEAVRFPNGSRAASPTGWPGFATFPGTSGNASSLPPGVPLPPGAQFSLNNRQGDPLVGRDLVEPTSANQQPAALSMQQPAALTPNASGAESTPLASAAQASWSIVNSPDWNRGSNILRAATCVSASDCWAVGDYLGNNAFGGQRQTLVEHWDGVLWTLVSSPNAPSTVHYGVSADHLNAVTCVSAFDCWAVGDHQDDFATAPLTLIEHWDGTSWVIVSSPNVVEGTNVNSLYGVACVSASDCWAVGVYYSYEAGVTPNQTLIEHWDGAAWAIVSSPNASTTDDNEVVRVTCVSASDCWAVGYYATGSGGPSFQYQTLIEHWDGVSWTIVSSPVNNTPHHFQSLNGVTCVSASECWAVGVNEDDSTPGAAIAQTLIERWDGTSWAIVSSPNAIGANNYSDLFNVACASASDCWAVGGVYYGSPSRALIERWDGSSWSIVNSPSASGDKSSWLWAVACAPTSDCWTVGIGDGSDPYTQPPLVERWDGTSWTNVSVPIATTNFDNVLASVTCTSASECWAVGYRDTTSDIDNSRSSALQTLIEHWDGTSWAIISSPSTTLNHDNVLAGVACVSASDCWAVGHSSDQGPLVERWDGTSWAIVSTPAPSGAPNQAILSGVTCVSTSDCWAVGATPNGISRQTLIEHWDGTGWVIVSSPNLTYPAQDNILSGVACVSTSDCWAVGYESTPGGQTLIERWDGTSWAVVASANTQPGYFLSVTCVSASDCWAVGSSGIPGSIGGLATSVPLIVHWDGTLWTIVNSPNTGIQQADVLNGVTCASASDCRAVGYTYDGNVTYQTLIERWDGTSWAITTSPSTGFTHDNRLYGVTCVSTSDCWAVGSYYNGNVDQDSDVYQTLTEHYGLPFVQLSAVVSRKTHGGAGTFDINLPLAGTPGIECRSGGASSQYMMVFTFANTLTSVDGASITSGGGSVTTNYIDSTDAHNYIVNLTGVTNAQTITASLTNVTDSAGDFSPAVAGTMGVLVGDTNGDGFVNSADISQTKSQSGQPVTSANFREDLNVDGFINSADISLVKSTSGTALP